MRLNRHSCNPVFARRFLSPRRAQSGVALIVTIILLSVITFLTVAFLALSGREKGATKGATDQTTSRLAADTALERAKVEVLTGILNSGSLANYDLSVSTNYISPVGFQTAGVTDARTNVSYVDGLGNLLTGNNALQNLTNLLYSPRPPVFITNRLAPNSMEFRYFLDLNRNGRFDGTGLLGVTNALGLWTGVSNVFKGDPQWIGILERPEQMHSSTNKFVARYAYAVVPIGKTLDVNYIHNAALSFNKGNVDSFGADYFRNQGIGGWEINLAAFLHDLNTNSYAWGGNYYFDTNGTSLSTGNAFVNAGAIYRYRLNGDPAIYANSLASANNFFSAVPFLQDLFATNRADEYSAGPLMKGTNGLTGAPDFSRMSSPWAGSDNPFHLFTAQDFFDPKKVSLDFVSRLNAATNNTASTYDQFTYYRLLSQLGTDSEPETGKINLNFKNLGGPSSTNVVEWTAADFFTNVANTLIMTYTSNWLANDYASYTNHFQITNSFGATNIPVFVQGRFVYSPAVHRVLQLAANIWDAKTNRTDAYGPLPTVFLPLFTKISTNIYVNGFREIERTNDIPVGLPIDLTASTNAPATNINQVFGVPLVIGAVKGLPNFNEFASESVVAITRKLQLVKSAPGGQSAITATNQVYDMNISFKLGAEFWNSYRSNYTRPVSIIVDSFANFSLTNDRPGFTAVVKGHGASVSISTNNWKGWKADAFTGSFIVPLRTNVSLFTPPTVSYLPGSGTFTLANSSVYDTDQRLLFPRWNLSITNRLQAMVVEQGTGRIIDYVLLGGMSTNIPVGDLMAQLEANTDPANPFTGLWVTNATGALTSGRKGVYQQIRASRGDIATASSSVWNDQGSFDGNRPAEIAKFKAFFTPNGVATYTEGGVNYAGENHSLVAYTPFNPTWAHPFPLTWQANDPLVHYMASDMLYLAGLGATPTFRPPNSISNYAGLENIGSLNKRYQPWPSDGSATASGPNAFSLAVKDPMIRSSDDWVFPTNNLPTIGWLGRIHRGTPWQTVYLKSSDLDIVPQNLATFPNSATNWVNSFAREANRWAEWTGNQNLLEGFWSRPVSDRVLFDVLTAAPNDNATRGRLSVNQTNLASWSALLSGVVVLTNANTDTELSTGAALRYNPLIVDPVGVYDPLNANTWPSLLKLIAAINAERERTNAVGQYLHANGYFERAADVLATPELTIASPFLRTNGTFTAQRGLTDVAYEWLPQQVLPLLKLGDTRFAVYAYGQSLRPAENSIVTASGAFSGLCTNYAITAEVASRAVIRVEGTAKAPRLVIESYNYLPPD